MYNKPSQA
ncbi:hypothetical protein CP8484711_2041A, partial [Chlamydia psittaci 84-8471/1]